MSNQPHDMTIYVEKTTPEEQRRKPPGGIEGWGADLDPQVRPAYPKERTPPRFIHRHWDELEHQQPSVKVFHSTERPGLTPVYGTTAPPKGVSGMIRRAAFRYSENDMRHWMLLLLADRVDVGEGLLDDLAHGHVPNLWKEMGLASEWKHNRVGLVRKAMVLGAVVGVAVWALNHRNRRP